MLVKNCKPFGRITDAAVKNGIFTDGEYDGKVIDGTGLTLLPAFFDMHCHLRDPGFPDKETVTSGLAAAAHGGFTGVMPMPNTSPVTDSPQVIGYVTDKARPTGVSVYPVAAATVGLKGTELSDFSALIASGAAAFSDDGRPISDDGIASKAIILASSLGSFFISHCETKKLNKNGAVTPESEEAMIERDCGTAITTGSRLHIAHVSTARGIEIIREAKARGARVTAETCPHYFCFTENDCSGTMFKMSPPLRTEEDRKAIIAALKDGTLDVISTDHAPHTREEKSLPYEQAPNGVTGFETAFAAGYTRLVRTGLITLERLCELMSYRPRKLLGLPCGLGAGAPADFVLAELDTPYTVCEKDFLSRSVNSPFVGERLYGKIVKTVRAGKIIYGE